MRVIRPKEIPFDQKRFSYEEKDVSQNIYYDDTSDEGGYSIRGINLLHQKRRVLLC
jgi:hypothetical protein